MNRAERRAFQRRQGRLIRQDLARKPRPQVVYNARGRLAEGFCLHPRHGPLVRVDALRHDWPVPGGLGPEECFTVRDNPDSQMPGWCPGCKAFWWYDPESDTFATLMLGFGQAVIGGGWFRDADLAEIQVARVQVQVEAMGGVSHTLMLLEPDSTGVGTGRAGDPDGAPTG